MSQYASHPSAASPVNNGSRRSVSNMPSTQMVPPANHVWTPIPDDVPARAVPKQSHEDGSVQKQRYNGQQYPNESHTSVSSNQPEPPLDESFEEYAPAQQVYTDGANYGGDGYHNGSSVAQHDPSRSKQIRIQRASDMVPTPVKSSNPDDYVMSAADKGRFHNYRAPLLQPPETAYDYPRVPRPDEPIGTIKSIQDRIQEISPNFPDKATIQKYFEPHMFSIENLRTVDGHPCPIVQHLGNDHPFGPGLRLCIRQVTYALQADTEQYNLVMKNKYARWVDIVTDRVFIKEPRQSTYTATVKASVDQPEAKPKFTSYRWATNEESTKQEQRTEAFAKMNEAPATYMHVDQTPNPKRTRTE